VRESLAYASSSPTTGALIASAINLPDFIGGLGPKFWRYPDVRGFTLIAVASLFSLRSAKGGLSLCSLPWD
jgi:hypothetical protein